MKKLDIITLLLCFFYLPQLAAQDRLDSLERLMEQQYKPAILGFSENGSYVAFEKRYGKSSDTITVYSTSGKGKEMGHILNMKAGQTFLKEQAILSRTLGRASYWNFKNGEKIDFHNIKLATPLTQTGMFSVLYKNDSISVFDINAKRLYSLGNVVGFPITDGQGMTYVKRKIGSGEEIYDVSGKEPRKVYASKHPLAHVLLSNAKSFLIAIAYDPATKLSKMIAVNTRTGKMVQSIVPGMRQDEYPSFTEYDGGRAIMVCGVHRVAKEKTVELWYGHDGKLADNEFGSKTISAYWVMDFQTGNIQALTTGDFTNILPLGNERHFLAFSEGAGHDYRTSNEHGEMSLFDLTTKDFKKFDVIKNFQLYLSVRGESVVYRSMDNQWVICELRSLAKHQIGGAELRNPVFRSGDKEVYFESDKGLYRYSVPNKLLEQVSGTENKSIKIINRKRAIFFAGNLTNYYRMWMEKDSPLILEAKDKDQNLTSYLKVTAGKTNALLPAVANYISTIFFSSNFQRAAFVEENYNLPPRLVLADLASEEQQVLLQSNKGDKQVKDFKQELIHFQNSEGKSLKGLLYYPADFDAKRKYPMVVRIYQVQSHTSNRYYSYGYTNDVAFELRELVEKGYFVYLPDIVFGAKGTGLSALDCVNKSLDAIVGRSYIDTTKIGLTGHSHGGYETNFIATQSSRFAAYLSGAGNSDIVRSYFSYNYNFHSPFYWQFEDGQYEMPAAFAKDKELYFRNNPIHYTDQVKAPVFLWAGKKDENIAWDQVMEFYVALKRHHKKVIAVFYPEQGHAPRNTSLERKDLYRRVGQWWDYFLKDQKDVDWIDKEMKSRGVYFGED